jgi:hypothetical protein
MKTHLFKIVWLTLLMALTMMILVPCSVNAAASSNVSQARYVATIRITNNGTTAAYNASIPLTLNTSYLVNNGYMAADLSNTAMRDNFGNDTYYNPAVVANHTWMIFVPVIPADSSIDYALYMGGSKDMSGNLSWMPGTNGGTTANSTSLNHYDFLITQTGYLNTDYYLGKNLCSKLGVFCCNISATKTVNFTLFGCNSLNITNINSGFHNVTVQGFVTGSVYRMILGVDGNVVSLFTSGASFSPGSANWQFSGNNTWPALEHQTIEIGGVKKQDISWQNAAIWVDSSGYGNNLTPTFRTTTTNANVSASLIDIRAFNQAALTSWNLNDYSNNLGIPDMPGGMYEGVNPTFPGSGIPGDIEASTGGAVPQNMFWFIIPCLVVVGIGMMVHDKIKSLFAQFIIILVLVLFISLTHIWSFWVLVPIILIGGSATLAGKIFNY